MDCAALLLEHRSSILDESYTVLERSHVHHYEAAGEQFTRARELAQRVAAQAPLAVQAALNSARIAVRDGDAAAEAALQPELVRLASSEDAAIGMTAFVTRTPAEFIGR